MQSNVLEDDVDSHLKEKKVKKRGKKRRKKRRNRLVSMETMSTGDENRTPSTKCDKLAEKYDDILIVII